MATTTTRVDDGRPDISTEVAAIARKLGLDINTVCRLDIGLSAVDATVYLLHPDTGRKYIPPGGTDAATEVRTLPAHICGGSNE